MTTLTEKTKQADEKFCRDCGEVIKQKAELCPKCGLSHPDHTASEIADMAISVGALKRKNKIGAASLALFLGIFGAHKFYLGQTGMGLLYLAFFWTFIPLLISLVEFILLLTMSDEDFNQQYGHIFSYPRGNFSVK